MKRFGRKRPSIHPPGKASAGPLYRAGKRRDKSGVMTTTAPAPAAREPEAVQNAEANYDPFTGAITLAITTANCEPLWFELIFPQVLHLHETLSDALSERMKDAGCIGEPR